MQYFSHCHRVAVYYRDWITLNSAAVGVGVEVFDYNNPHVFIASLHNRVERSTIGVCLVCVVFMRNEISYV